MKVVWIIGKVSLGIIIFFFTLTLGIAVFPNDIYYIKPLLITIAITWVYSFVISERILKKRAFEVTLWWKVKTVLANVILILLVADIAIKLIVYSFKAYFLTTYNPDGPILDGLGRQLYEPPLLAKWLWSDMPWPGTIPFIIDTVRFWVLLGFCYGLGKIVNRINAVYSTNKENTQKSVNIS